MPRKIEASHNRTRVGIYCEPQFSRLVPRACLRSVALKTLKLGGGPIPCSLSLAFVGDSLIRNLNREYRALDRTTDVLSFSSEDLDPEYGIVHIGDVVVSVQAADRQAAHVHRELSQELEMLVAHGVLHLLGFDHNSRAKRTRMLGLQGKILRSSDHSDGPR